jgi:hypothetical protein
MTNLSYCCFFKCKPGLVIAEVARIEFEITYNVESGIE